MCRRHQSKLQFIRIPGLILGLRPANETALLCNDVSHWLAASLASALNTHNFELFDTSLGLKVTILNDIYK